MNETQQQIDANAGRIWAAVVLAGAVLLFFAGGGPGSLRGRATASNEVTTPEAIEPAGEQATPPAVFRWKPGRTDAVTQVVIHRVTYKPVWSSEPLRGVSELEVPPEVYEGLGAGEPLLWRVREASGGKAVGSSAYVGFSFRIDANGYGPGQAPELYDYLE